MKTTSRIAVLLLSIGLAAVDARAAAFEKVVPVSRGMRLDVRLFGGEVAVRGWNRDEVRIRATHFATDVVDVRSEGRDLSVRARARTGKPHAIDFAFEVPTWMAVSIRGTYVDVSVQGTAAAVSARTVRGDVRVSGGSGDLTLASTEGEVVLEGGRGTARLESVNNAVRVSGFEGELVAETVSGSVKLQSVSASSVVASAVSGDISWEGAFAPQGSYQLATHSGDVDLTVPDPANATLAIRSFEGHVHSTLAETLPDLPARRKRFTLTLGSGAASAELETFTGTISLRRQ